MATTVAELVGKVTVDTQEAIDNLDKVGESFGEAKKVVEEAGTAGNTIKETLASAIGFLGGFVGDAVGAIQKVWPEISKVVGEAQQLDLTLEALGESSGEVAAWMGQLEMARGYDDQAIKDWYVLARNLGFTADGAKDLIGGLTDMGVVFDKQPGEIESVIRVLGRMNETGVMSERVLTTLGNQGASLRGVLAEAFGVPTTEIDQMIKDGLIPANVAISEFVGWLDTFGPAAQQWQGTLPGLTAGIEGLKEAGIGAIARPAVEAVSPLIQQLIGNVADPNVIAGLESVGAAIGQALTAGITGAGVTIDKLFTGASGGVADFIEKFKSGEWGSAISDLVINMQFAVMEAGVRIKAVGETIYNTGKWLIDAISSFISELVGLIEYHFGSPESGTPEQAALVAAREARSAAKTSTERQAAQLEVEQAQRDLAAAVSDKQTFDMSGVKSGREVMEDTNAATQGWLKAQLEAIEAGKQAALADVERQRALASGTTMADQISAAYPMPAYARPGYAPGIFEDTVALDTSQIDDRRDKTVDTTVATLSGKVEGALAGANIDGTGFVGAITNSIDSAISASSTSLQSAGKRVWDAMSAGIEAGFTAGASASGSFRAIIEGMVNAALAGILSGDGA